METLINKLRLPVSFVSAVCQNYQPCRTGFRHIGEQNGIPSWDFWALIPFRVRVPCKRVDSESIHISSAGTNQMNPYNYVHLKDVGEDVRGSHVAIHVRHNGPAKSTTVLAITFLDERFQFLLDIPLKRLTASVEAKDSDFKTDDGLFTILTYLDVIVEWWNDVFYCFNEQLVDEVSSHNAHRTGAMLMHYVGEKSSDRT
jgi:hypothetical protein